MSCWWLAAFREWSKGLEINDLAYLLFNSILPESVVVLLLKLYSLIVVPGDLDTMLVLGAMLLSLSIKDPSHPDELLGVLGQPSSSLPAWLVYQVIVMGILGKS